MKGAPRQDTAEQGGTIMSTATTTGRTVAVIAARAPLSTSELAQVLFASPLQMSAVPSVAQVRGAIDVQLNVRHRAPADCAAYVAQEAGDHPESYAARMHWALDAVARAYPVLQ